MAEKKAKWIKTAKRIHWGGDIIVCCDDDDGGFDVPSGRVV